MIDLDKFDFLDIGCGSGGVTGYIEKLGGTKGIGVAMDDGLLKKGESAGLQVAELNPAVKENFQGKIRLTVISSYLERLDNFADIKQTIGSALHITRSMVVIRCPWFDSDGANLSVGLKTAWADRKSSKYPVTSLQLHRFLFPLISKGMFVRFAILGNTRITHSGDERILPLDAENENSRYERAKHGPKPMLELPAPTYAEMVVVIAKKNPASVDSMIKSLGKDVTVLFDSKASLGATAAPASAAKAPAKPATPAVPVLKSSLSRKLR